MATSGMVHVRVDDDDKNEATRVLADMGLSVSTVVRILLKRVAREQAVPFDLRVPNEASREAIREAEAIAARRSAKFPTAQALIDDIEKRAGR